jgi:hypothetical protein
LASESDGATPLLLLLPIDRATRSSDHTRSEVVAFDQLWDILVEPSVRLVDYPFELTHRVVRSAPARDDQASPGGAAV